ncbi:MAG: flagellar biosynthetic protein FliO [Pseudomonadota bacterium]
MTQRTLQKLLLIALAGAPAVSNSEPAESAIGAGVPSWISIAGNLFMLLALIVAAAWILRRLTSVQRGNGSIIRVLAAQSLGARDRLLIIDVAGQQLVVAQTPQGLSTLHAPVQPLLAQPADEVPVRFAERLAEALRGKAT